MKYFINAIFLVTVYTCYAQPAPAKRSFAAMLDSLSASYIGKPYPIFDIKTVDGRHISSETIKNKVLFISFWFE